MQKITVSKSLFVPALHRAVSYLTALQLCCTALRRAVLRCSALHRTALRTALRSTALRCALLCCTALCCAALRCTVLDRSVVRRTGDRLSSSVCKFACEGVDPPLPLPLHASGNNLRSAGYTPPPACKRK